MAGGELMAQQVDAGQVGLTGPAPEKTLQFRAEVATVYGDTVTVAMFTRLIVTTTAEIDLLVAYSRDGGANWIDRGTVDRLQPGIVHVFLLPQYGTDLRVTMRRVGTDATVQWHGGTRPA